MNGFNEYKDLLVEFLYGEITPERERKLLEHLHKCKECQEDLRELREAREIVKLLEEEKPVPPPVVIIEKKENVPWFAAIFLFFFFLFLIGFRVKWGDNEIEISTLKSSNVYEYLAEVSGKKLNFQTSLEDFESYFEEINQGGEK